MKSPEMAPKKCAVNHETEMAIYDLGDAVKNGIKEKSIPAGEALKILRELRDRYPITESREECLTLISEFNMDVPLGRIPADEVKRVFQELLEKYKDKPKE